jgi:hypothetical protein
LRSSTIRISPAAMIPNPDATTSPTGSLSLSFCAVNEAIRIATGPGAIARPVSVVDQCHACCRNRLSPSSCIPRIVPPSTIVTFAALNTRLRNICGSMTGTGARRVLITNPTAETTARAQLAMMRPFPQPHVCPLMRPKEMAPIVRITITVPTRSGILAEKSWRKCGIIFTATVIAAIPIGRLIRKIQRQLSDVSRPPMTGPIAPAAALLTAHRRTLCLTRAGGMVVRTSARLDGISIAAPIAWTHRNTISTHRSGLTAHARLAIVKTTRPSTNTPLRPILSLNRPAGMSSAPKNRA